MSKDSTTLSMDRKTETFLYPNDDKADQDTSQKKENSANRPTDAINTHRHVDQVLKINVKTPIETNMTETPHQPILEYLKTSNRKFHQIIMKLFSIRQYYH